MPRNNRELAKRKLQSCLNRMNWAGTYMVELQEMYGEKYPDITDVLRQAVNCLQITYDLIEKLNERI